MSDVLIRDVPGDDLDLIRSTASGLGMSLQSYLRGTLQAHATYLRRQQTLADIERRLAGRSPVPEADRDHVLAAMATEHDDRATTLLHRDDISRS